LPEILIALRAVFGQDEVGHGTTRYRVGSDGGLRVPPEVARYLVRNGGLARSTPARNLWFGCFIRAPTPAAIADVRIAAI
jgi:hypothetical protein